MESNELHPASNTTLGELNHDPDAATAHRPPSRDTRIIIRRAPATAAARHQSALGFYAVDANQTVFAIGQNERRITMHSQQIRAYNLAWALTVTGKVGPATRVAIVGGGLAGATAAAALTNTECSIDLFARAHVLFDVQLGSHRFVHPTIFDWPLPCAFAAATTLPALNWRADEADSVARSLNQQFRPFASRCRIHLGHEVVGPVRTQDGVVTLDVNDGRDPALVVPRTFDIVILAVGFGLERSLHGVRALPYWRDDSLHQTRLGAQLPYSAAVVGAGDGGVTDALRLSLHGFDQGTLLSSVGNHPEVLRLGHDMVRIEGAATIMHGDVGQNLSDAYDTLQLPHHLLDVVGAAIRADTQVTLFEAAGSPYQLSASILNRLLLLPLVRMGKIDFKGYAASADDLKRFDVVVPRIGPMGALTGLLSPGMSVKNREPDLSTDLSTTYLWDTSFFRRGATPRANVNIGLLLNGADRHNRDLIDRIRVGVLEHNQRRRGAYISLLDQRLDTSRLGDPAYRASVTDRFAGELLDLLIIPSSDSALHAAEFGQCARKVVICCEANTLYAVAPKVEALLGRENLFLIPQVLDLELMVKAIKLGFRDQRVCYIRSDEYPVDKLYFDILAAGLADSGDGLGGVELFDHAGTVHDFGSLPKANVYSGRYFVHAQAPAGFMRNHPYISGYAADFEAGAVAVLDINDAESGRRLVESALLPIAFGYIPPERVVEVHDMFLGVNLDQAARFGLNLSDDLIRLATDILENTHEH